MCKLFSILLTAVPKNGDETAHVTVEYPDDLAGKRAFWLRRNLVGSAVGVQNAKGGEKGLKCTTNKEIKVISQLSSIHITNLYTFNSLLQNARKTIVNCY